MCNFQQCYDLIFKHANSLLTRAPYLATQPGVSLSEILQSISTSILESLNKSYFTYV